MEAFSLVLSSADNQVLCSLSCKHVLTRSGFSFFSPIGFCSLNNVNRNSKLLLSEECGGVRSETKCYACILENSPNTS